MRKVLVQPNDFSQFSRKNSKIYGFRLYVFKKQQFFGGGFFKKDYIYYTKNLFFTTKDALSIVKNQFFSYMFTFLSVYGEILSIT